MAAELDQPTATRLARVADRDEITEVLALYCRGVDRCDVDTLRSAFHPDAIDDHGTFTGSAWEFAAWAVKGGARYWHSSHHSVHNVIIDWVEPDVAQVESYVIAFNRRADTPGAAPRPDWASDSSHGTVEVFAGRYVDRFERRDGAWKIAHRQAIRDVDTLVDRHRWGGQIPEGGRFPDDPLYRVIGTEGTAK